jgi:hypothetical protein
MSILNTMRGAALGLSCLMMLTGCSNAPDQLVTPGTIAKMIMKQNKAPAAPSAQQIVADVAKALAATDAPLILVSIPKRHAVTVMQRLERNGGYGTYGTADRRSITLRTGMLTGTRGLGNDVMSSDIDAVLALVSTRRAGSAKRVMRYLDGEEMTLAQVSTCTVRVGAVSRVQGGEIDVPTTQISETCKGDGQEFTNTYQVAADGRIMQSRQWHSPLNGYLTIQSLR